MIAQPFSPVTARTVPHLAFTLLAAFFCLQSPGAVPFTVQGLGVNSNDFRVTVFASGLDFPLGMAKLPDGSLLVGISQGANFFNSTGKLLRFVDANDDGIADGAGTVLYSGLPSGQTAVRVAGNLVFVTGQYKPITVLRLGLPLLRPSRSSAGLVSAIPAPGTIQIPR